MLTIKQIQDLEVESNHKTQDNLDWQFLRTLFSIVVNTSSGSLECYTK